VRPQAVEAPPRDVPVAFEAGAALVDLVTLRWNDLARYQDRAYADRYLAFVERARAAEGAALPGSEAVTEAVARYLYKLMAYKDEYEVARLVLEHAASSRIEDEFGAGARTSVLLHPPILRRMGLRRKIRFGPRTLPVFRLLHTARRLRGTRLDPFGADPVRRTERQLVEEYRDSVERALAHLDDDTVKTVIAIAEAPDRVRGYEEVKARSVAAYREEVAGLLAALDPVRV
jgi:indolepyruvate ferredoxin oxidoreductase